ncbi:MAG TPA: 2Fe-2S iron-sulfur cluster-binding protein [Candidatus Thermoplasmatota archaeon]|jgi:succinate dehydrogenase / fumarate reductase iron-sulfur subunit|nr:2Fe-2S iron-sulfur cluster-binding protein [Candidatus Thermoplasmatota archaeon]
MQLTELKGVSAQDAERLKAAGLGTSRDIQLASDEKLAAAVGADLAKKVRKQLGTLKLDETGRNDYLKTMNVKAEKDLDLVKVEPFKAEAAHAAQAQRIVTFRVWRTADNGGPAQGRFQEYRVEVDPGMTVLQALHRIKETQDPTLTFRRSCGQAICGICAVRLNRKPKLICHTLVDTELEHASELVLQPLGNLPTIRDLVCDQEPFWKAVEKLKPWLIRDQREELKPDAESIMHPDDLPDVIQMANCINCAVCFSDCDARRGDQDFLGPMAAAKIYRFVADPRDGAREERLKMVQDSGLWRCMFAYQCAWCPKGVDPQEAIVALRRNIIDGEGYKHPGARHTLAFVKSVTDFGRLNEGLLPLLVSGPLGALRDTPKAVKWAAHGKIPIPHWLEGRHEAERFVIELEDDRNTKRREEEEDREKRLTQKAPDSTAPAPAAAKPPEPGKPDAKKEAKA